MADVDEFMYSCGLEVLHPGGLEKTDEMARACGVGRGKRVLDIGSGKGVTACYLAERYGCEVVGIDVSERMVGYARELARRRGLSDRVEFRVADAHSLPFEDESFDIVIAECTTVLLDRERAFREFLRVLKPGGCLGDLEMIWRREPPGELVERARRVWGGFTTMTLDGWVEFFKRMGLVDVRIVDFTDEIPDIGEAFRRELGFKGMVKMACKLILRPDILRAMIEYWRIFREYKDFIGYAYIIGRKPERRNKDPEKIRHATLESKRLSRRIEGWSSVEEIRRWRERG